MVLHLTTGRLKFLMAACFFLSASLLHSQHEDLFPEDRQKGKMYIYWGWNWGWFSQSDIHYTGDQYNFTLKNVAATDRQTEFTFGGYFNPAVATIPQYNFRVGYFFHDHYSVSIGTDHMKYVVTQYQTVPISGYISNSGTEYDGTYNGEGIVLDEDFVQLEHTDGLNYVNIDLRRYDELFDFGKLQINLTEGLGAGMLYPKTNSILLQNERYDAFHIAGYGFSGVVALNVTFFRNFFLQSEFKAGYINMPDIRTTRSTADKASQAFTFTQLNIVFGATFRVSDPGASNSSKAKE